uniref:Uncharacterized protein n=2 Tax=Plectus sambesii TaxID=2011161 RepID=A0A914W557_9BILA
MSSEHADLLVWPAETQQNTAALVIARNEVVSSGNEIGDGFVDSWLLLNAHRQESIWWSGIVREWSSNDAVQVSEMRTVEPGWRVSVQIWATRLSVVVDAVVVAGQLRGTSSNTMTAEAEETAEALKQLAEFAQFAEFSDNHVANGNGQAAAHGAANDENGANGENGTDVEGDASYSTAEPSKVRNPHRTDSDDVGRDESTPSYAPPELMDEQAMPTTDAAVGQVTDLVTELSEQPLRLCSPPSKAPPTDTSLLKFQSEQDSYKYYTDPDGRYFSLDAVGYWYYQGSDGEFKLCHTNAAEVDAAVDGGEKPAPIVPIDSEGHPVFPKNEDGKPVLPVNEQDQKVFPVGDDGHPLFPFDKETNTPTFPVGDDGQPVFPIGAHGNPVVPTDANGLAVFPKGPDGSYIFPSGANGKPVAPMTKDGRLVVPLDAEGKAIVPYDSSGQPLIHLASDGVTPLTDEQYQQQLQWQQYYAQMQQYQAAAYYSQYQMAQPVAPQHGYAGYGSSNSQYSGWQGIKATKKIRPEDIDLPVEPAPEKPAGLEQQPDSHSPRKSRFDQAEPGKVKSLLEMQMRFSKKKLDARTDNDPAEPLVPRPERPQMKVAIRSKLPTPPPPEPPKASPPPPSSDDRRGSPESGRRSRSRGPNSPKSGEYRSEGGVRYSNRQRWGNSRDRDSRDRRGGRFSGGGRYGDDRYDRRERYDRSRFDRDDSKDRSSRRRDSSHERSAERKRSPSPTSDSGGRKRGDASSERKRSPSDRRRSPSPPSDSADRKRRRPSSNERKSSRSPSPASHRSKSPSPVQNKESYGPQQPPKEKSASPKPAPAPVPPPPQQQPIVAAEKPLVFVNGVNDEKKEWPSEIVFETHTVPMLQFSSRPDAGEQFTQLKRAFDLAGGARAALKVFRTLEQTQNAEEKERVETETREARDNDKNLADAANPQQPVINKEDEVVPDDKWRPVEAEKVKEKEKEKERKKQKLTDPELERLRLEALTSMETAKKMLAEVERREKMAIESSEESDSDAEKKAKKRKHRKKNKKTKKASKKKRKKSSSEEESDGSNESDQSAEVVKKKAKKRKDKKTRRKLKKKKSKKKNRKRVPSESTDDDDDEDEVQDASSPSPKKRRRSKSNSGQLGGVVG